MLIKVFVSLLPSVAFRTTNKNLLSPFTLDCFKP